jgi:hypothetical protein
MPPSSCCLRLALFAVSLTALSCNGATQVIVDITTDRPCNAQNGTAIIVGHLAEIEDKPPADTTLDCDPGDPHNRIGQTVVIPSGGREEPFAIKVVLGVDRPAEKCTKDDGYAGCIVARRALNFIPHKSLKLPIFLSTSCEGVGCTARPGETCVLGECVPAKVPDPDLCEQQACDEGVLTGKPNPTQAVAECGRPTVYADAFDAPMKSSFWEISSVGMGATATQPSGALTLGLPDNPKGPEAIEYRSRNAVNLDNDGIRIEVPTMLKVDSMARAYLAAKYDATNQLIIEQQGGMLRFRRFVDSLTSVDIEVPYEPENHKWWEIRSAGPNIVMRTSANGLTWVPGVTFERPGFADSVNIVLGAATEMMMASPGQVTFDNLSGDKPKAVWCKARDLSDTFNDEMTAPFWAVQSENNCSIAETKMGAVFTATGIGDGTCAYKSRAAFDLTANPPDLPPNGAVLKLADITGDHDPALAFFLTVQDDKDNVAQIGIRGDVNGTPKFYHVRFNSGGSPVEVEYTYDALQKYLRIAEANGAIVWQTSSDGSKWNELTSEKTAINTAALSVTFGVRANGPALPGGAGISATVSAYNPPP